MGWTERKEILTSFKSIMNYIEKEDSFHDYRIGTIHYLENEVELTIEEVIPGAKIQDSTGFVWDFHFKGVTFFKILVDMPIPAFLSACNVGLFTGELYGIIVARNLRKYGYVNFDACSTFS